MIQSWDTAYLKTQRADYSACTTWGIFLHPDDTGDSHIKDAVHYLQASGVQVVAATEKAKDSIFETDLIPATAIVMGSEGKGVSPAVLKAADRTAHLPMVGPIESLNVSVACGVFLYEAVRQRASR